MRSKKGAETHTEGILTWSCAKSQRDRSNCSCNLDGKKKQSAIISNNDDESINEEKHNYDLVKNISVLEVEAVYKLVSYGCSQILDNLSLLILEMKWKNMNYYGFMCSWIEIDETFLQVIYSMDVRTYVRSSFIIDTRWKRPTIYSCFDI